MQLRLWLRIFLGTWCAVASYAVFAQPLESMVRTAQVRIAGTGLRVDYPDGSSLSGTQLVGKEIQIGATGAPLRLRIDSITADRRSPDVLLHEIYAQGRDGQWQNICTPDAEGKRLALAVAGYTRLDGSFAHDTDRLSITCSSGAQGKCLRLGYSYWKTGPDGQSMLPLFNACMRMVRADYCGDGRSWTQDGTTIDVYDDQGIQVPEKEQTLPFEAGWTEDGAVCVHHPRIAARLNLQELAEQCPRLASTRGEQCSESWARKFGKALLYNRSGL